jgi:hypothetical protein
VVTLVNFFFHFLETIYYHLSNAKFRTVIVLCIFFLV